MRTSSYNKDKAGAREKAETLKNIREAFLEFKNLQAGKGKWTSWEDFKKELEEDDALRH